MSVLSDPNNMDLESYRVGLYQHLNAGNPESLVFLNRLIKFSSGSLH